MRQITMCGSSGTSVSPLEHSRTEVNAMASLIDQLKNRESPPRRSESGQEAPHRVAHGSTAWAVSASSDVNLYQPQDGVVAQRRRVTDIASRLRKLAAGEPED